MWKWVMNGVDTPYTVPTTLTPVVLKTPCHLLSNNEHTVVKKIMNVFTTTWNCCYERRSTRVAEVAREHGWHPPKSLDSDENFKPEHTLFCRELWFVAIHELLEIFGQTNVPFGVKTVFLGQDVHYYMVYIANFTELNLQICNYAKRRICRENCKYGFDENFHGHFCPGRKAAKFCHPAFTWLWFANNF